MVFPLFQKIQDVRLQRAVTVAVHLRIFQKVPPLHPGGEFGGSQEDVYKRQPLSYATILGGTCSVVGTSTNVVVLGQVQKLGYEGCLLYTSRCV